MSVTVQEKNHRFTVTEFLRMGETGIISPKARVELLDGQIIDMSPIGHFHGGIVARLVRLLNKVSRDRWLVWPQSSMSLNEFSEPQPDIILLKPSNDDYTSHAPVADDVLLLIEVAESSLNFDRQIKLPLYGRAGIPEVWIVNLIDRVIEVYRDPNFTGYSSTKTLHTGDKASSQLFPDVVVDVAELLNTK